MTSVERTPNDHMVRAVKSVIVATSWADQIVLTGTPVVPVEGWSSRHVDGSATTNVPNGGWAVWSARSSSLVTTGSLAEVLRIFDVVRLGAGLAELRAVQVGRGVTPGHLPLEALALEFMQRVAAHHLDGLIPKRFGALAHVNALRSDPFR